MLALSRHAAKAARNYGVLCADGVVHSDDCPVLSGSQQGATLDIEQAGNIPYTHLLKDQRIKHSIKTHCFFFSIFFSTSFPFPFPSPANNIQHNPKKATTTVPIVPASTHFALLAPRSRTGTSIYAIRFPVRLLGGTCINLVFGPNSASYPKCSLSNGFAAIFAPSSALQAQKTTGQGSGTLMCDFSDAGR
jgi:hypothetical protein